MLIQVPGGAWSVGYKRVQAYTLMSRMVQLGWICVSIDYSKSPRATFPAHLLDVKRAIAWVRENIADYGGDPDFIAITGGSAGAHLASLAALTPNDPPFQPPDPDSLCPALLVIPRFDPARLTREVESPRYTGRRLHLPGRADLLLNITAGRNIASDRPFPSIPMANDKLRPLLRALSEFEQAAYFQTGKALRTPTPLRGRQVSRSGRRRGPRSPSGRDW